MSKYDALNREELINICEMLEDAVDGNVTCEGFDYKQSGAKRGTAKLRYKNLLLRCTLFQEEKDGKVIGSITLPNASYDIKGKRVRVRYVEMPEGEFRAFQAKALEAIAEWCKENPNSYKRQSEGVVMPEIL